MGAQDPGSAAGVKLDLELSQYSLMRYNSNSVAHYATLQSEGVEIARTSTNCQRQVLSQDSTSQDCKPSAAEQIADNSCEAFLSSPEEDLTELSDELPTAAYLASVFHDKSESAVTQQQNLNDGRGTNNDPGDASGIDDQIREF
jgi:hypothetical protein